MKKIRRATNLRVFACEGGTLHVELLDANGDIFAEALMPVSSAELLHKNIGENLCFLRAVSAIGECKGHA